VGRGLPAGSRPAAGAIARRKRSGACKGIHAIVYALFDEHERLDRAAMARQVAICLAAGAHGMAALGLASEVAKLSLVERLALMQWVAEDVGGRVPLAFTIYGASVAEQVTQIRQAEALGADWLVLQPPLVGGYSSDEYLRFFGRTIAATHLPVAIQNAPAYLGRGISSEDFKNLRCQFANLVAVKAEGPASEIHALVESGTGLDILSGRGGLEIIDNLRAGCVGLILAPDMIDRAVSIYESFAAGREAEACSVYREILPGIVFVMQSLESLACYGKRLFGRRAGIAIFDRAPALQPSPFGLAIVERLAAELGSLYV
jgi:2-keto-3-deoxy-L-arabinonate dehydratase